MELPDGFTLIAPGGAMVAICTRCDERSEAIVPQTYPGFNGHMRIELWCAEHWCGGTPRST